jgi:hypothetical protein
LILLSAKAGSSEPKQGHPDVISLTAQLYNFRYETLGYGQKLRRNLAVFTESHQKVGGGKVLTSNTQASGAFAVFSKDYFLHI